MPSCRWQARDRQPRAAARSRRARAARPSTAPFGNLRVVHRGDYPLTISQEGVFIQLFLASYFARFSWRTPDVPPAVSCPVQRQVTPPGRAGLRRLAALNTDDDPQRVLLVIIERLFYRGGHALGQPAA